MNVAPNQCTKLLPVSTVVHTPWGPGRPLPCAKFFMINVSVHSIFVGIGIVLIRMLPVLAPVSWPLINNLIQFVV